MNSLRAGAIVFALALVAAIMIIWKPWNSCDAPDEVCDFVAAIEDRDGILGSKVSAEVMDHDAFAKPDLSVDLQFVLSDQLAPVQAEEIVLEMAQRIQAGAHALSLREIDMAFVAGPPQNIPGSKAKTYPLEVSENFSDIGGEERAKPGLLSEKASFAFRLRQLGAASVANYSATAANLEQLLTLGKFAAQANRPTDLALADRSVRYSPENRIVISEIELVINAANRGGFQSASIDNSGLILTVGNDAPAGLEKKTLAWLDHYEPFAEPMAYKLIPRDYADIAEGWVGSKKPEWLIPKPVVLPDEVKSWPANQSAPLCADEDLEIVLGTPDAAAGSRYMPVYAKNISARSCALQSYPQIDFLNEAGEAQPDIALQPEPDILLERVAIPSGEAVISTLDWNAMSTSLDPDQTVALSIAAAKGMKPVQLAPEYDGQPTPLDILDGAQIIQSPWVQARAGWGPPDDAFKPQPPTSPRP
ncbi:DUF4232 domain-containing protein [Glutamicibacter sp.]|uniref:DUF4232 domain-containing protein n=1 Tax=Glutamicibacter sp. TaxID=1931995 RepID=UPI003D6BBF87